MGEKGNLLDMSEEIFANLADQGPQFWLDYEKYKLSRAQSPPGRRGCRAAGGGGCGTRCGRARCAG